MLNLSDERVAQLLSFNAGDFLEIPVSRELVTVRVRQKIDDLKYNHGAVVNPWRGTKLFFPCKGKQKLSNIESMI